MEQLLIFPFNGNGIEALDGLDRCYGLAGFIDDDKTKQGQGKYGPVFSRDALTRFPDAKILAVPGNPTHFLERQALIESLRVPADRWASFVHPRASVSAHAVVGKNTLIMAGAVVSAGAQVGNHVCILPNTVIHHDSVVGDYTLIGSNVTIAGRVTVGKNCYIGSGSSLIQEIEIGERSMIGMGSTVIRTVTPGSKVAGNPARAL